MRNILSFHKKIESALKSYEEIVAMATSEGYPRTNTIAELNTAPTDYYDKLNNEGHLITDYYSDVINGISYARGMSHYNIRYNNGNWVVGYYRD